MSFVLAPTNELILHFVDRKGKHSTSVYWLDPSEVDPLGGAALAISSKAQAVSSAALVSVEIKRVAIESSPGTPGTSAYQRPADKAKFVFSGSDGSPVIIEIGAPIETDFDTGTIDILATDTNVSAFIGEVLTNCRTAENQSIRSYTSGFRRRPSRRKHQ
jgi:hypothetical protein